MIEENKTFEEAYERLKKASSDETLMAMYRNREKAIRDWNDSINSARKDGVQQGVHLGEQRVNALYERLLQENRGSEIPKAIADPTFRTKLFNEYGIEARGTGAMALLLSLMAPLQFTGAPSRMRP